MGQESKIIQPTQEEIESVVKSAEEQMKSFKESEKKIESEDKKMWQKLEEQMTSPEGLEGIEIPGEERLKKPDPKAVEKRQALLTEFRKWENNYSLGIMGLEDKETPEYSDADVKFDNQNNFFDFPITFMDYLVDNALAGFSEEFAKKIKDIADELEEITFYDILVSGEKLWLDLKSSDRKVRLQFKAKYPFQCEGGSLSFE